MKLLSINAAIVFKAMQMYQKKFHRLPEWYLFQTEKTATTSPYELLVLKETDRGKEVFLIKRPEDDPYWPGQWHFPGTIQRYWDDFETILKRLADELGIDELPSKPKLIDTKILQNVRGRHTHIFLRLDVDKDVNYTTGKFFPISELPRNTIGYEKQYILDMFKKTT